MVRSSTIGCTTRSARPAGCSCLAFKVSYSVAARNFIDQPQPTAITRLLANPEEVRRWPECELIKRLLLLRRSGHHRVHAIHPEQSFSGLVSRSFSYDFNEPLVRSYTLSVELLLVTRD